MFCQNACGKGHANASFRNIARANAECVRAWQDNGLTFFPIFIVLKPLRKIIDKLTTIFTKNSRENLGNMLKYNTDRF